MDWGTVFTAILSSSALSSGLSLWISSRHDTKLAREDRHDKKLADANDALAEVRTAYSQCRAGELDDTGLQEVEHRFDAAINKCCDAGVTKSAASYKETARRWASGDKDLSTPEEERAHEEVSLAIQQVARSYVRRPSLRRRRDGRGR